MELVQAVPGVIPRRAGYQPPPSAAVQIVSLRALLGHRTIPADQQDRIAGVSARAEAQSIWCVGNQALLTRPCVAVVGTRDVSQNGIKRARRIGRELAEASVVVVSGLAKGVDAEALSAAIEAGGQVIAVIGTPIDHAYPAENKRLQETIYRDHLLVSQFAPGSRVFPGNFPQRNKLMAQLSDATVIIEASDTSGTLHQASQCTHLGRWLFIAQSVLDNPTLSWPRSFVRYEKTRPLTCTEDVLAALR